MIISLIKVQLHIDLHVVANHLAPIMWVLSLNPGFGNMWHIMSLFDSCTVLLFLVIIFAEYYFTTNSMNKVKLEQISVDHFLLISVDQFNHDSWNIARNIFSHNLFILLAHYMHCSLVGRGCPTLHQGLTRKPYTV